MVIKPTETCLDGMQYNAWKKTCQNTRLILATLLKRLTNLITGNQNSGLVREYSSEQPLAGRSLYSWRPHGGKYWKFLAGSLIILQTREDKFYAKYVCIKDITHFTQHYKGNLNKTENTKTTTITAWKLITLEFSIDKNLNPPPPPPFRTKFYLVKLPLNSKVL